MNLVIVESPTKGKTIEKFLGKDYQVLSSYGHIRDLPVKELGVDVKKDFTPKYVIPPKARTKISELKKSLAKSKETILATDEDREGEAIAFHLAEVLTLKEPKRIVFHEITKTAIEKALKQPRGINMDLVNAQQARRILDRLVGYKLSPLLWKKIFRGLSAGRVQSVAVRLVVEREREIEKFKPAEYWSIEALLKKAAQSSQDEFKALLIKKDNKAIAKLDIKNKKTADKIVKDLAGAEYKIVNVEKKEVRKNPLPPFITSTLQQAAGNRMGFGAKMTMRIAQNLYERGLITYHRTDSLNLSGQALAGAKNYIVKNYGKQYWSSRVYKTKSNTAQEAHEAIRPTRPERVPDDLGAKLDNRQRRLYDLIWRRFMACQMSQAVFDASQVDISAKKYLFRANGQILKFDGFLKAYPMKFKEDDLPSLKKNEILELKELLPCQHFTQPPARYNEAGLIKVLEKEGVGRPSTYAPIMETIQQRNYVCKNENKRFQPTEIGLMVNDLLVEHFPKIVDIKFTAEMENDLDKIAQGREDWIKTLQEFYQPFEKNLKQKEKEIVKEDLVEETAKICPECGAPMVIRWSRFGKFYACSKFPECKYKESMPKPTLGITCPKCQKGEITEKRTKKGKTFYACNQWPKCDFALWDKPTGEKCPDCGSLLIETNRKQVRCSKKECYDQKRDNREN